MILNKKREVDSEQRVPSVSVFGLPSAATGKKGMKTCDHGHQYAKIQQIVVSHVSTMHGYTSKRHTGLLWIIMNIQKWSKLKN